MSTVKVLKAYDESLIEELPLMTREEAFAKMDRAYELYTKRDSWLPGPKRIEILEKTIEILKGKREELAMAAAEEGGKPLQDSLVEIDRGINGIKVAIEEMGHLTGEEIAMGITPSSMGRKAFTTREPRGVVVAVSAFNHPFNLIVHQVVPAIAVGCPVLVKPAKATPLSCRNLLNVLYEAGLPEEWASMLVIDNKVATELISDPRTSFLTFIGSSKVGWSLRSQLPPGATCALEHGGVAPAIMDETADLDESLPLLVKGGFYHGGQVCVSVQRLYVHDSLLSRFQEIFVSEVQKLKVGDPTDLSTEVGPLISPSEVDRVHEWVTEAVEKGATLLCGGKKISNTCYEPTVLLNPSDDVTISQKEIFGPVVCLYSFNDIDDAVKRANSLNVSFQASVFSKNLDTAFDVATRLNGLAVMINDHTAFRVDWMPFGGTKESGLGVGGIGHTMKDMTIEKMLVIKSKAFC